LLVIHHPNGGVDHGTCLPEAGNTIELRNIKSNQLMNMAKGCARSAISSVPIRPMESALLKCWESISTSSCPTDQFNPKLSLENTNMKTQEQTNLTIYSNQSYLSSEQGGLQIIRVPVGTFAGTRERLFLIQDGEFHGFDLGNQGGGQN
jgi:hypothetical protein